MSHSSAAATAVGTIETTITTGEERRYCSRVRVVAISHASTVSRGVGRESRIQSPSRHRSPRARQAASVTEEAVRRAASPATARIEPSSGRKKRPRTRTDTTATKTVSTTPTPTTATG